MCSFSRGYHEKQFCEIILNLDQWFRRCCLKDFLSRALAASMFGGLETFTLFFLGHYGEHSCVIDLNLGQCLRRCRFEKSLRKKN